MWLFVAITGVLLLLTLALWFRVTQPLLGAGASGRGARAEPARLEAHVRALSVQFVPRDAAHPEGLELAAAYVRRELGAAGGVVAEQPYEVGGRVYRNVVASFGPETRERIVVGAHYDAAGPLPGADDNASGVAGLLELARMLGASAPPLRVELVAYTLEEPPFFGTGEMGSAVHARSLRAAGVALRAMISLEMIGFFSDAEGSQRYPSPALKAFYPSRGDFITVVGKFDQGRLVRRVKRAMLAAAPLLPVYSINAPRAVPGVDFSDQSNYWDAGYDALMITDTAFYRNPNYHTARDTPDTLDYTRMALVVEGVHAAVLDLSRSE
jgi:Zn-dependent M28 family amino/carboxypeptidase